MYTLHRVHIDKSTKNKRFKNKSYDDSALSMVSTESWSRMISVLLSYVTPKYTPTVVIRTVSCIYLCFCMIQTEFEGKYILTLFRDITPNESNKSYKSS